MAGDLRTVADDDVVFEHTVMAEMHVNHQQVVAADGGFFGQHAYWGES